MTSTNPFEPALVRIEPACKYLDEEVMHDVDTIVDRYKGWCDDGGQIDEDHVPFSDMFRGAGRSGGGR